MFEPRAAPVAWYETPSTREGGGGNAGDHDVSGAGRPGQARAARRREPRRAPGNRKPGEGARPDRAPVLRDGRLDHGRRRVAERGELPALLREPARDDRADHAPGRERRAGDPVLAEARDARRRRLGVTLTRAA